MKVRLCPMKQAKPWLIHPFKDWSYTEFTFSFFSHKLRVSQVKSLRKENTMSTIVFAVFLTIRVILPVSLLIAFGEWIRRREANYWLHK